MLEGKEGGIDDDKEDDPFSEGTEESVDSWEDLTWGQSAYPDRIKVLETSKWRLFLFASRMQIQEKRTVKKEISR